MSFDLGVFSLAIIQNDLGRKCVFDEFLLTLILVIEDIFMVSSIPGLVQVFCV